MRARSLRPWGVVACKLQQQMVALHRLDGECALTGRHGARKGKLLNAACRPEPTNAFYFVPRAFRIGQCTGLFQAHACLTAGAAAQNLLDDDESATLAAGARRCGYRGSAAPQ